MPPDRITEIVNGVRAVSAQTAVLLGERLGTSAEFWMNLQVTHDLERAREEMGRGCIAGADETAQVFGEGSKSAKAAQQ